MLTKSQEQEAAQLAAAMPFVYKATIVQVISEKWHGTETAKMEAARAASVKAAIDEHAALLMAARKAVASMKLELVDK
jgi:hypothetical protein